MNEYARNEEQLAVRLLLESLHYEEEVIDEVIHFANEAGIHYLAELVRLFGLYRDEAPAHLDVFACDPPLTSYLFDRRSYEGDFPSEKTGIPGNRVARFCSLEIPRSMVTQAMLGKAPWLEDDAQQPRFYRYLDRGDYHACWMTANSRGWFWRDFRIALQALAEKADRADFRLLVVAWCAHEHDSLSNGF